MQKMGCPESFTEPLALYHLARRRGMNGVTITDHNSIDGCLDIAHLENAFLSCEYTAYFPEDRCKVHVLVHGIDEKQHDDLMRARDNIHDLVHYTIQHGLNYTCAHPLYSVNDRLTPVHIERLILMFKNFEWNGDIHPGMNAALEDMLKGLTPVIVDRLSNQYDMAPLFEDAWHKNIIGGSDDHSSLRLGTTFTEVENCASIEEFWQGVRSGQGHVHSEHSTPQTYARNIYGIMYQFCKNRFELERYRNKDILLQFLERILQAHPESYEPFWSRLSQSVSRFRRPRPIPAGNASLLELVRYEADRLLRSDSQLIEMISQGIGPHYDLDAKWFDCVNQISNNLLKQLGRDVFDRVLHARILELIQALGSASALYLMLAPYFVGFSARSKQRQMCRDLVPSLSQSSQERFRPRVAHFTDTFHEVNGVARTLRQQLDSALALGKDYTIITVSPEKQSFQRGVHYFSAIGAYDLPEYPELKLLYPPFLQMLNHCYNEGFTHLHVSTPGLVGLAALAIARILQIPISGTYHTAIPEYAKVFTEDSHIEDLLWKYMIWFYDQMDVIYVPSQATASDLTGRGISTAKVCVYPRGVDIERFHPTKASDEILKRFSIMSNTCVMLYVGRVSKEKGLPVLCQAFRKIHEKNTELLLVIVGDGPYRTELEAEMTGLPAIFTGYLDGDDLPSLYASSDFLVLPSATDTFGNVVLEAHASGIPVIVTNKGGPAENTVHQENGLIVEADNPGALANAIQLLASDTALCKRMGQTAREYIEKRGFSRQFEKLWDLYTGERPESSANGEMAAGNPFRLIAQVIKRKDLSTAFSLD